MYICKIFHQNRCSFYILYNNISYFVYVIDKAYASYDICLRTFGNYIASNINITFGNSIIEF